MLTVSIGGYASSGGTALRDALKGFEDTSIFPGEFRLIKERYGLLDLQEAIIISSTPENTDLAIKDFIWLCSNFAQRSSRWRKSGLSYDFYTNGLFSQSLNNFVSNIVSYQYPMYWYFFEFRKVWIKQIYNRILIKLGIMPVGSKAFMSTVDINQFNLYAKQMIEEFINQNQVDKVSILHNAIPIYRYNQIVKSRHFFSDLKIIIVDRDPRDIFLDMYEGRYLGGGKDPIERARSFVEFYKHARIDKEKVTKLPYVKIIRFEDLCFKYNETLESVTNFIGIKNKISNKSICYFKPLESASNVGLWRRCSSVEKISIRYIEKELECF